jgi:protein arginine N-methyltransferase 1
MGARRVVAVEPDASLQLGKTAARACGLEGAVEFIRGLSWNCNLDEPADILVSDLRGALPLFERHIPAIVDARKRLLKPGGVMIGQRDLLYAAAAELPETYAELTSPWRNEEFDLVFEQARRCVLNDFHRIDPKPEQLLTAPVCWAVLDYRTIESPDVSARLEMRVKRAGLGHGLVLWFDAELAPGIGFSNAPGQPKLIYGRRFLPWFEPVPLQPGDAIQVEIHANLVGNEYIWRWNTEIPQKACFRQSTFYSQPLWKEDLRKRAGNFTPSLNEDGEITAFVLNRMNGNSTVKEIAAALQARFPARFKDLKAALAKAGELARAFGSIPLGRE